MKKMFKAAASIAVGCALLSTSAFAALTSSNIPTKVETASFSVKIDGGLAAGESTILGLKGSMSAMPESILDADILYINQATVTETTVDGEKKYSAEYNVGIDEAKLKEAGAVSFFAGGTAETSASWLGTVLYSTGSNLPEGAKIEIRNANPYGLDGYAVVKVTGITEGSVKVGEVDAYLADYTANGGIRQYLAIVPYTEGQEFSTDDIVWDEAGTPASIVFGDMDLDEAHIPSSQDSLTILRIAANLATTSNNMERVIADVDADGSITSQDALTVLRIAANLSTDIPEAASNNN